MKSTGTSSISEALRSIVVGIAGLVLMCITSVLLTGLTLAILPILLLSFRWFILVNKRYTTEQLSASAEASTVAEECFGSIRTVSISFQTAPACRQCRLCCTCGAAPSMAPCVKHHDTCACIAALALCCSSVHGILHQAPLRLWVAQQL